MITRKMFSTVVLIVIVTLITGVSLPRNVQAQCLPNPCSGKYSPQQIRSAYDVSPLIQAGFTGVGVTVALVNSGVDKYFSSDINSFDGQYGIPALTYSTVAVHQGTVTNVECGNGETTADAEMIHAMSPGAKILLVLTGLPPPSQGQSVNANTACPGPLGDGFSYVIDDSAADIAVLSPSVLVSASTATNLNTEYAKSVKEGTTLIAASNDWGTDDGAAQCGSSGPAPSGSTLMPQYSPYVTAVGGTASLTLNPSGGYGGEVGWNCSGGGASSVFTEPNYQELYTPGAPQNGQRNMPDIALVADGEASIYSQEVDSNGLPTAVGAWWGFYGTSAAAPLFAGIMADILQAARTSGTVSSTGRLGFINPTLYQLGAGSPPLSYPYPFHNITQGCSYSGSNPNGNTFGYCPQNSDLAHGDHWNFVTGWGSIDATKLAQDIIYNPFTRPTVHIVAPLDGSQLNAGQAYTLTGYATLNSGGPHLVPSYAPCSQMQFRGIAPDGSIQAASPTPDQSYQQTGYCDAQMSFDVIGRTIIRLWVRDPSNGNLGVASVNVTVASTTAVTSEGTTTTQVLPFTFQLSTTTSSAIVTAQVPAAVTVVVTITDGSPQPVELSVSGLPSGASYTFNVNPVLPTATSTLTITVGYNTPPTFPTPDTITITGTGGGNTVSTSIQLYIESTQ